MTEWYKATFVSSTWVSKDTKSITLKVPGIKRHIPGQYYSVRITNKDNHLTQRIYSAANKPNDGELVELGVQIIRNGELSPHLHGMKAHDEVEIKGPLGNYFIVDTIGENPVVLISGGVGVVPYMSIFREHAKRHPSSIISLTSFRSEDYAPYYEELKNLPIPRNHFTFTRIQPKQWAGYARRIDRKMILEIVKPIDMQSAIFYICGSSVFVEDIMNIVFNLGVDMKRIKIERFG